MTTLTLYAFTLRPFGIIRLNYGVCYGWWSGHYIGSTSLLSGASPDALIQGLKNDRMKGGA